MVAALLTAWIIFSPAVSKAQDATTSTIAKARQLVEITGALTNALNVMTALLPAQIETQRKAHPEIPMEFWDEFSKDFNDEAQADLEQLEEPVASLYASRFSEQEIDTLLAFYRSDVGIKSVREQPGIAKDSFSIGQEWGKLVGERAGRRAAQSLQNSGARPQ